MSVDTPAMARCAARRSSIAAAQSSAGLAVPTGGSRASAVLAMRNRRCWKRQAPVTPDSVHSRSRSGGESDHEPARSVGAVVVDDLVRVDDVLLRLGHLLGAADLDRA